MSYPKFLRELFDINNLPVLDLKGRGGSTDYIDFLQPNDLNTPIMKGVDRYGRSFIAIKLLKEHEPIVITLFQRYTDDSMWVNGSESNFASGENCLNSTTVSNDNEAGRALTKIVNNTHPVYSIVNICSICKVETVSLKKDQCFSCFWNRIRLLFIGNNEETSILGCLPYPLIGEIIRLMSE